MALKDDDDDYDDDADDHGCSGSCGSGGGGGGGDEGRWCTEEDTQLCGRYSHILKTQISDSPGYAVDKVTKAVS